MKQTRLRIFTSILASVSFLSGATVHAQESATSATLTVTVRDAHNAKGLIRIALFRTAEGFPSDPSKALSSLPAQITRPAATAVGVFRNLAPGVYAVAVFHDENNNGRLDKNLVGVPKEGYGFSNNPTKRLRPPTFNEASFTLNSSQTVEIKLLY